MARFEDTAAADIDLEALQAASEVVFVKLVELEEIEFIVLGAALEKSTYNEANMKAVITLIYPDQDTETDDTVYQLSTEQKAIKDQVKAWQQSKQEFPIEGVTVRIYAGPNSYGKYSYSLAPAIPAVEEEKPTPKISRPMQQSTSRPMQRDMKTDDQRGRLASRPLGRAIPKR